MGAAIIVLQIAALWLLNAACYALVGRLHLAIPGNVVGLVVLYALFAAKVVPIRWFERSASLLVKHLAFFFIPITVGLMDVGALLEHNGIAVLSTLILSGGVGFLLVGMVSQRLGKAHRSNRIVAEPAP